MSGGFEDLGLLPELVRATQECGWVLPSDVQDEAIPLILGGGDVMVAAETGSGKTGAFALPAIQLVYETRRADASGGASAAAGAASGASSVKRARMDTESVRLSLADRSPMLAVAPDGVTCQCRQEKDWGGVRATRGILRGRVYYEARICDDGLCRFGWSSKAGSLDLGTDKHGFGYGGTGKKSNDRKFDPYGEEFKNGDVIGCLLELTDGGGAISFTKNGKSLGVAFSLPRMHGALFPAICMKNAECRVNFGTTPFTHAAPEGFVGVAQAPQEACVGEEAPSKPAAAGASAAAATGPVCIVLEPARDLAEQTHKSFAELSKYVSAPSVSQALIIGGVDNKEITRQLTRVPDIITATPGKLMDLVESNKVQLGQMRLFILDEADRFTDAENLAMITKLHTRIKAAMLASGAAARLQVCFFSATLHSPQIANLSKLLCEHPTWVDLKGKDSVPETVHHVYIPVDPSVDRSWTASGGEAGVAAVTDGVHSKDRIHAGPDRPLSQEEASEGIKRLKQRMLVSLIDSLNMDQCLIFCRTNLDCDNLEAYLTAVGGGQKFRAGREKGKENPYSCVVLAGMRSMDERRRNLDAFRSGDVRFLICTDVAARGLDIKELPYVINMTLPDETENYIHRIGRVGRADRMGLAISLVATTKEKVWYHTCANRGKGCSNTKLVDAGGCTIWYDEPALFGAVKQRLGMTDLPAMSVARHATSRGGATLPYVFSLPPELEATGVVYGEERGEAATTSVHVEALRDHVAALAALETKAQNAYLALKQRFGAGGSVTAAASAK